jgi:hypothetical protein
MTPYEAIFKRRSFHKFNRILPMSADELDEIKAFIAGVQPLDEGIKTDIRIVPETQTGSKRGGEYCILFYSEEKGEYLRNIGYMGEQIDLYLAAHDIGALWYGFGKDPKLPCDGLSYVIMLVISKVPTDDFRKDVTKAKRKPLDEIWQGTEKPIAEVVRFAPSACNTQPWFAESTAQDLKIYRKLGRMGLIPASMIRRFNRIDMGIFLCFTEVCLKHAQIPYERTLFEEDAAAEKKALVAQYHLQ